MGKDKLVPLEIDSNPVPDNQQRNEDHSPVTARNSILPTTQMILETDFFFSLQPPYQSSTCLTSWTWSCETLNKEPSEPVCTSDLQNADNNQYVCACFYKESTFVGVCYTEVWN